MITITKERLLTIKQWRETYGPDSNVVLPAEEAEELARIALASLEAEPVAWMRDDADGREYNARNEFSGGGGGVPLYATPPVPVVPEEKPMPNPLSMYTVDAVAAIAEVRGWNACRAAMLHGAEPVSQTYKLPPLSSREVNDAAWKLHNMLTEHGPLNGCQFNNLKECFYEALKVAMRNYPVTPDGWISCSERMPDDRQEVVVQTHSGWRYIAFYESHSGLFYDSPEGDVEYVSVTHWMPLPEPPQEVNRG
ncbi:TPA: DUF551 domain-containing protein [Escherichia coli]|nr:DUF551 domain-containing protein [Escherichia coli]